MFTSRLSATAARSAGCPCLVTNIMLHDKDDKNDKTDKNDKNDKNDKSDKNDKNDKNDNNNKNDSNHVKTNLSNWYRRSASQVVAF